MNKNNIDHQNSVTFCGRHNVYSQQDCCCIAIINEGDGCFCRGDKIAPFHPYDCFLLYFPDQITFISDSSLSCCLTMLSFSSSDTLLSSSHEINLGFSNQFSSVSDSFYSFALDLQSYAMVSDYILLCSRIQCDSLPGSIPIYQYTLNAMLLYLSRFYAIQKPKKRQSSRGLSSQLILIEKVKHLIHQNFSEALSLSYIADYVFTNPSYLSRTFKSNTGTNLSHYINQVRVENAKHLLLNTDELIIDIAVACGFNYIPHFNRVFREITKLSPTKFRRQFRQGRT